MESLALLVTAMIFVSVLGAPIGWLILKIPTHKASTTNLKKLFSFIFTLLGLMVGTTIFTTGPAMGGVFIALFSITSALYVFTKLWRDKTYWEH